MDQDNKTSDLNDNIQDNNHASDLNDDIQDNNHVMHLYEDIPENDHGIEQVWCGNDCTPAQQRASTKRSQQKVPSKRKLPLSKRKKKSPVLKKSSNRQGTSSLSGAARVKAAPVSPNKLWDIRKSPREYHYTASIEPGQKLSPDYHRETDARRVPADDPPLIETSLQAMLRRGTGGLPILTTQSLAKIYVEYEWIERQMNAFASRDANTFASRDENTFALKDENNSAVEFDENNSATKDVNTPAVKYDASTSAVKFNLDNEAYLSRVLLGNHVRNVCHAEGFSLSLCIDKLEKRKHAMRPELVGWRHVAYLLLKKVQAKRLGPVHDGEAQEPKM
ncbi:MAG: hypothetical protein SGCHY_000735 [Lobulomycetales sp.]